MITVSGLVIVFLGLPGWVFITLPGVIALGFLAQIQLIIPAVKRMSQILLPFAFFLFFIHGFFFPGNQTALFTFGPFEVGAEGLIFATQTLVKLLSALALSFLLIFTTHPADLIHSLMGLGLSHRIAYLIGSPLLLIPQMAERVQTIKHAQQSRGLSFEGGLFRRMKALLPIATPLILGSLVDIEERTIALEVRGFSAPVKKTYLRELKDSRTQKILRIFLVSICVLMPVAGLFWRTFGNN